MKQQISLVMNKELLEKVKEQKGNPCVTIQISTEIKSFSDKEKIQLKVKNILKQVENELKDQFSKTLTEKIVSNIKTLIDELNFNNLKKGIGLFVSNDFSQLIYFPLEIRDKLIIYQSFDVRDFESTLEKMIDYAVLLLSKNRTRFFSGSGNVLNEIINDDFPAKLAFDYEVFRSSPHSLYNGEESKIDKARSDNFFRSIDQLISIYANDKPLILLGTKSHLTDFINISRHGNQIVGEISGNYDKNSLAQVSEMAWLEFEGYLNSISLTNSTFK